MTQPRAAGAVPIAGYYLLYFGTVGVILPFLPAYLKSLSLSGAEVGLLLALSPLGALLSPPFWGYLADRWGRPDRVLTLLSAGAMLGFSGMLVSERFGALAAALAAYAFFVSSVTSIIDSVALQRVAQHGGSFGHLRMFGSLGFVCSSLAFGFAVPRVNRTAVVAPLALMAAYVAWTFTLRARSTVVPSRGALAGVRLLGDRRLALLLAATCLHWIACAPYHGTFSIHVTALGLPPSVVGTSAAAGVIAEIAVMLFYPRFAARLSPPLLLCLAFVASALRWAGMAWVERPEAIVALSLFHGMTFGAFYLASVGYVSQRVPDSLRASGQALYVAVTFGLGGLIGYPLAGAGYDALGGHRLFSVGAGVELLAAALALGLARLSTAASPLTPRNAP